MYVYRYRPLANHGHRHTDALYSATIYDRRANRTTIDAAIFYISYMPKAEDVYVRVSTATTTISPREPARPPNFPALFQYLQTHTQSSIKFAAIMLFFVLNILELASYRGATRNRNL